MNSKLNSLLSGGDPSPEEIDAFLAGTTFPMVEGHDITFVYQGEADEVFLRCWISGLDAAQPFHRLGETDLWMTTIELPPESRIEYKFEVVGEGGRQLLLDPFNPVRAHDPFGANSVCQGAGYTRPEWTLENPHSRRGSLKEVRVRSRSFGETRRARVYLPARYREASGYPVLIVHDGDDYLRFAQLDTVLDNLITALEIPEMVVVLTQSHDRLREYAADERHAEFVAGELLPHLERRFALASEPRSRVLGGASFGAIATLHAATTHPGVFGNLLLQSGSFAFSDLGRHQRGPAFDPVVKFMNAFRESDARPAERIYMSCGIYESLIYENRSLLPNLQKRGIETVLDEARDAHNWENWRDRLRDGLSWLLPGPVWMVYE
ncbi:MAG: alpha/beta hydrolase-fold protein [Xanthomonadales bacterium]|nr:alpha/beta hydrolase-fold protein [Xanthomonadales bacterium]